MIWRFSLQHPSLNGGDWTEVPEPVGWDEAEITIARDAKWHGIDVTYSLPIKFIGEGATFLHDLVTTDGIDEQVLCRVEHSTQPAKVDRLLPAGPGGAAVHIPSATDPIQGAWATVFEGRVNLGSGRLLYEDDLCMFDVNLEQDGKWQTLRSRLETQVDLRSLTDLDGGTLPDYTKAPYDLTLLPKVFVLRTLLKYGGDTPFVYDSLGQLILHPGNFTYNVNYYEPVAIATIDEIGGAETTGLDGSIYADGSEGPQGSMSNLSACFRTATAETYQVYVKATFGVILVGSSVDYYPTLRTRKGAGADFASMGSEMVVWQGSASTLTGPGTVTDVVTIDASFTVSLGALEYLGIAFSLIGPAGEDVVLSGNSLLGVTLDSMVIDIQLDTIEAATDTTAVLINEAFARLAESITGRRVTARSLLFGRHTIASEPLPNPDRVDGDAHNIALSTGLLIRRINEQTDGEGNVIPTPLSMSLQELLDATNACYNIGWALEDLPDGLTLPTELSPVTQLLRVEEKRYFYKKWPLAATLTAIREYELSPLEKEHYTRIEAGFEKADVEGLNGLNEFNTRREWQSNVRNSESTYSIRCKFVGSGYLIEKIRRIDPLENASADTQNDSDRFFICTAKTSGTHADGETYAPLTHSERAENFDSLVPTSQGNLVDGDRSYNLRIAPQRNLQRHAGILFAGTAVDEVHRTYYEGSEAERYELVDGTMELLAGESTPTDDRSYLRVDFGSNEAYLPSYIADELTCDYPLSWRQYLTLRQYRYHPVLVEDSGHANGYWYIRKVQYEPAKGMAKWTLVKAYPDACLGVEPTITVTQQDAPLLITAVGTGGEDVLFDLDQSCCDRPILIDGEPTIALPEGDFFPDWPADGQTGATMTVPLGWDVPAIPEYDPVDIYLPFTATACDFAHAKTLWVRLVPTPPAATGFTAQSRQGCGNLTFNATPPPMGTVVQWSLDNFATVEHTGSSFTYAFDIPGSPHTVYLRLYNTTFNTAGPVSTTTATLSMPAAPTAPAASYAPDGSPYVLTGPVLSGFTLEWSLDNFATVEDTGTTFTYTYTSGGSPYTVYLRWADSCGNYSAVSSTTVTVFAFLNALRVDGVNDIWTAAHSSAFDFGTGDFAIAMWVRADTWPGGTTFSRLLNKWPATGLRWALYNAGAAIQFQIRNAGGTQFTVQRNFGAAANTWYFIVVNKISQDTANWRIWIDGVQGTTTQISAGTLAVNVDNTHPLELGRSSNLSNSTAVVDYDEVMLFNDDLTNAEIAWLYNGGNGAPPEGSLLSKMILHYKMDALATSGFPSPTIADDSGNGHTLTGANVASDPLVMC